MLVCPKRQARCAYEAVSSTNQHCVTVSPFINNQTLPGLYSGLALDSGVIKRDGLQA